MRRGNFEGLTIPDVTAASFDNPLTIPLVVCQEAQDEEAEADGTNPAQSPLYSRLLKMRLKFAIVPQATTFTYRWMVVKRPDGEQLVSSLAATTFNTSDDTPTAREQKKNTLAKGWGICRETDPTYIVPRISRMALRRCGSMRENDRFDFVIAKDAPGSTALIHGQMNAWVKANA